MKPDKAVVVCPFSYTFSIHRRYCFFFLPLRIYYNSLRATHDKRTLNALERTQFRKLHSCKWQRHFRDIFMIEWLWLDNFLDIQNCYTNTSSFYHIRSSKQNCVRCFFSSFFALVIMISLSKNSHSNEDNVLLVFFKNFFSTAFPVSFYLFCCGSRFCLHSRAAMN